VLPSLQLSASSSLADVSRLFFSTPCDVAEQDGHRFPIPVPDVDVRFREVSERDSLGISAVITGNASR
jgi:hypothetical protein